jgi:hypothetical protein
MEKQKFCYTFSDGTTATIEADSADPHDEHGWIVFRLQNGKIKAKIATDSLKDDSPPFSEEALQALQQKQRIFDSMRNKSLEYPE